MTDAPSAVGEGKQAHWKAMKPIVAGVALAVSLTASAALGVMQTRFPPGYVLIGDDIKVNVTVASTATTREKGLSGREPLQPGEGMLFLFEKPDTYAFWMKDMKFPIDILWFQDGALADITTDAAVPVPGQTLPVYFPKVPVDQVLEVNAGFAKAHGLRTGMPLTVHIDKGNGSR